MQNRGWEGIVIRMQRGRFRIFGYEIIDDYYIGNDDEDSVSNNRINRIPITLVFVLKFFSCNFFKTRDFSDIVFQFTDLKMLLVLSTTREERRTARGSVEPDRSADFH